MKYSNKSTLPNDWWIEQALLNIIILHPKLVKDILPEIKSEIFYYKVHKILFATICELFEITDLINLTVLLNKLEDQNNLEKIGGIDFLLKIVNRFEETINLQTYITELNEKYLRRLIITLGKDFISWGYTTTENLEKILEKMEQAVYSLNQQKLSNKIYKTSRTAEIITEIFNEMQSKKSNPVDVGLKTSFHDLDSILQGFQKADLIIIAGRPSMGKTAFSLNLGKNIVQNYKIPLIIFTLEMPRQQIIYRFLSTSSNINTNRLKSGRMNNIEWKKLGDSMKEMSELPIFIDDNPNLTLIDIRLKYRKILIETSKPGFIIIDYLQLMKSNLKIENRTQEISYITRNLKILAKEFGIPIILLSQLNRANESRTNKRPMLSDLRESGCIGKFISNNNEKKINSWTKNLLINKNFLNFTFKGVKPTFLLTFENNIQILLTSNHKILSNKGWQKVSQITKNSEIYCLIKRKQKKIFYGYSKIINMQYQGLNSVYDQSIEKFHNYLNKNYILHNSIEQDADVVIMLYREDYYQEKTDQPQIIEVIVAKHRNGMTGTAQLLFKPVFTSFTNINQK
jgi:replicative DNA helicase